VTLNLKSQALDPLAVFAFPAVCQICNERRAEPTDGFVCIHCLRNVFRTQRPWCEQCGLPFDGEFTETTTCLNCLDFEWDFDCARSLFASKGLVREVIHRFKYNGAEFFQPLLNQWVRVYSSVFKGSPDWIVPIPLHPLKERERGFNQAECLAEAVAGVLGVPMIRDAVQRVKNTETQTHLSRTKRLANMNGAFTLRGNQRLMGTVMLVDDVMTTGATASACASVLKKSGASKVNVFTLARGLPI
jgi:competence protein ComFC